MNSLKKENAPIQEAENFYASRIITSDKIMENIEEVKEKQTVKPKRQRKTLPSTEPLSPEKQAEKEQVKRDNMASEATAENKKFFAQLPYFLNNGEKGCSDLFIKLAKGKFIFEAGDEKKPVWYACNEKNIWEKDILHDALGFASEVQSFLYEIDKKLDSKKDVELKTQLLKTIQHLNKKSFIDNVISLSTRGKHTLIIDPKNFDNTKNYIPCKNGLLLNPKNARLEKDTSGNYRLAYIEQRNIKGSDYITKTFCPFDITATCPQWEKYLSEALENNQEVISYLQKFSGYALLGNPKEDLFLVCTGDGRNGKGTYTELLKCVFSDFAKQFKAQLVLKQKNEKDADAATPHKMKLYKARLCVFDENDADDKWNVGEIKTLTSHSDKVTARPLYKEDIEFDPTHVFIYNTNHEPNLGSNIEYAFIQRLLMLKWNLSYVDNPKAPFERKKDPDLKDNLEKEVSGILNWLLVGCVRYLQEGLDDIPEPMKQARDEYVTNSDSLTPFLNRNCMRSNKEKTPTKKLFTAYKLFCEEEGFNPMKQISFTKQVKKKGYKLYEDNNNGNSFYIKMLDNNNIK